MTAFQLAHAARHRISSTATREMLIAMRKLWGWVSPDDQRSWPSTLGRAAIMGDATAGDEQFIRYTQCPNQNCGALYKPAEIKALYADACVKAKAEAAAAAVIPASAYHSIDKDGRTIVRCIADTKIHPEQPESQIERRKQAIIDERAHIELQTADIIRQHEEKVNDAKRSGHRSTRLTEPKMNPLPTCTLTPKPCDTPLVKVTFCNKSKKHPTGELLDPILMVPYLGIKAAIQELMLEHGFQEKIEDWRRFYDKHSKRFETDLIPDVYHGLRWEQLQFVNTDQQPWDEIRDVGTPKLPLLARRGTLALALNTDNFQPFADGSYSMGAVYVTILNLPREERNLQRNMILVALLPGPQHSSRVQSHQVFRIIADEINTLFGAGIECLNASKVPTRIYGFLHSVVCDLPAARVTCGFASYNAHFGCTCCDVVTNSNFSLEHMRSVEYEEHPKTNAMHRARGIAWSQIDDEKEREKYVRRPDGSRGSRYCALMEVNHFDLVRGTVIDPMHNMSLGVSKSIFGFLSLPSYRRADAAEQAKYAAKSKKRGHKRSKVSAAAPSSSSSSAAAAEPSASAAADNDSGNDSSDDELADLLSDSSGNDDDDADAASIAVAAPAAAIPRIVKGKRNRSLKSKLLKLKSVTDASGSLLYVMQPPILTDKHLGQLQDFINKCQIPNGVGRIPSKLDRKFSKMKAAEWSSLATMFAVPALWRMMAKGEAPDTFTAKHLDMMVLLQRAMHIIQLNVVTVADADTLHVTMLALLELIEVIFAPRVIKPNFHFALHLRQMILDNGPPGAFSCLPFERMNGLLSNQPSNKKQVPLCTMNRYLIRKAADKVAAVHIAALQLRDIDIDVRQTLGRPQVDDFVWVQNMLAGSTMSLDGGGDDDGGEMADLAPASDSDGEWEEKEHEPAAAAASSSPPPLSPTWPIELNGSLQQSGRTSASGLYAHTYRWIGLRWAHAFRQFCHNRLHWHGIGETVGWEPFPGRLRSHTKVAEMFSMHRFKQSQFEAEFGKMIKRDHMLNCLTTRYLLAYQYELAEEQKMTRMQLNEATRDELHKRLVLRVPVNWSFEVFNTLDLAGETYGSVRASPNKKNSHAIVAYRRDKTQSTTLWYVQIQFFFTNEYRGKIHKFAAVREYTKIESSSPAAAPATLSTDHFATLSRTDKFAPSINDVVPVQRLVQRFIPSYDETVIYACPIPSKIHA